MRLLPRRHMKAFTVVRWCNTDGWLLYSLLPCIVTNESDERKHNAIPVE